MTNFQLLSIGGDPIFRLGLLIACEQYADLQVVAEAATEIEALQLLEARSTDSGKTKLADLAIFDLETQNLRSSPRAALTGEISGLAFCRQLKSLYPHLPLLLLGPPTRDLLLMAQQVGANGYCPKGRDISLTMEAIRLVASGQTYWPMDLPASSEIELNAGVVPSIEQSAAGTEENADAPTFFMSVPQKLLTYLGRSGLRQIDATLAIVKADLQQAQGPDLEDFTSILDGIVLNGRRRELLAARWIISRLLSEEGRGKKDEGRRKKDEGRRKKEEGRRKKDEGRRKRGEGRGERVLNDSELAVANSQVLAEASAIGSDWQGILFDSVAAKLQLDLVNLTGVPLEIDILRSTKKLELLRCILQKLKDLLQELRFAQVQPTQLTEKMPAILRDLWSATIIDFFGRYYTLELSDDRVVDRSQLSLKLTQSQAESSVTGNRLEVVPVLLEDAGAVATEILDKIPISVDLFAHLLFETPLTVDNISCLAGSPPAMQRAEALLENLAIQVASGVIQPLLNNFAYVEEIKQSFYDGKLISTREIERFRNNLSWKYRWDIYFVEPKAIFESRFWLYILSYNGIKRISIYAPRNQELAELSGLQLGLTLLLEARDAIAPRARTVISLLGTGLVYVLTQVIGRGIGLIWRGVIQGIGNSLQDSRFGKNG
jgi:DNA-binding NarL/FixJ family response regulator